MHIIHNLNSIAVFTKRCKCLYDNTVSRTKELFDIFVFKSGHLKWKQLFDFPYNIMSYTNKSIKKIKFNIAKLFYYLIISIYNFYYMLKT